MPGITTSELPIPKSWDEFEEIVWDLYSRIWLDSNAQRNGRTGQRQNGVDIYGQPIYLNSGGYSGIQCKRYADGNLSEVIINGEIAKAEKFQPPLAEFIVATTEKRDVNLQQIIREINVERDNAGLFPVRLVFWEDLCNYLAYPHNHDLIRKHYPSWQELFAHSNEQERNQQFTVASNWDGETRMRYYDLSNPGLYPFS